MRNNLFGTTALASVATFALLGPVQVMADCLSVKGKILNTLHEPALGSIYLEQLDSNVGGVSTVGVVALNGEGPIGKLKCALVGTAVAEGESVPGSPLPALPSFTHTISCDDNIADELGTVHSQLTFDTTGYFTGYDQACTLSFTENSVPVNGSGTGVFSGTTRGGLTIEGTSNVCTKSIDMTFIGQVCMD